MSFICSSNEKLNVVIEDQTISNSNCENLLGVQLDSKLTFKPHVDSICRKAGLKLNAISRIIPYMDFSKRRLLVNAFFSSQFNYCPLIWMCHNRMLKNRINMLHERCLRLIYNDKHTSFEELLKKSVSINQKNLQVLVTEMFKIYQETSPEIMQEIFSNEFTGKVFPQLVLVFLVLTIALKLKTQTFATRHSSSELFRFLVTLLL